MNTQRQKKDEPARIFLTGAGTASAINVIKALRRQNELAVYIVTGDMNPLAAGLYLGDKHLLLPPATDEEYIPRVLEICRRESIQIMLPIFSKEISVFARHKKRFAQEGIAISVSDPSVVEMCNSKVRTHRFFIEHQIPAPKMYTPEDLDQPENVDFPLFIKPEDGRSSMNTFKIRDAFQLAFFKKYIPNPVVMEYVDGTEYTVDVLADLNGEVMVAVPRVRLNTKAGQCVIGQTVRSPKIVQMVKRITRAAGIHGQCNIQCIQRKSDGRLFFIEINPRFAAGGLMLAVAAGANIPLLLIKMLLGRPIEKKELQYKPGVYMLRYWEELFLEQDQLAT
ncbi:ATP-grasp domain-containing protein [bacterium]|nr:ATP-grasp domain-containing protein [bacterium]MCK4597348.1 ATP-grasp domain-containing protein [bacterium]